MNRKIKRIFQFMLVCVLHFAEGHNNIRLVGSNVPLEGRVEVYHQGEWGTICNNGWKDNVNNMNVVCKQLGLELGRALNKEYPGTGRIWLDGVACKGNEATIMDCPKNTIGAANCRHRQDVTVKCDVCKKPIVSADPNLVHDWSFSASSSNPNKPPKHARLKSTSAWCLPNAVNERYMNYLEIELPRLFLVSAVATLGGANNDEYVSSYRLMYSLDAYTWNNATVNGEKIIAGNTASGNENILIRSLDSAVRAKFIRFIPLGWGAIACMRVEICGYQLPHYPTVLIQEQERSAVLTWSAPNPGDEPITKYHIRYWKSKYVKSTSMVFKSTFTSRMVMHNLLPYMKYRVEISGVSQLGEGLARVSHFRTLTSAPTGSPTQISFKFLSDKSLNVSWSPPHEESRNGVIIAYIICFPKKNKQCDKHTTVPGSQTWYVLRGKFQRETVVEIQAQTIIGVGPAGRATSGVLEYTPAEKVAISLIIAITCGSVFIILVVIVILAAKGIILKNFVANLRKLTSSKITLSTEYQSDNKKNQNKADKIDGISNKEDIYNPPILINDIMKEEDIYDHQTTTENLYGTHLRIDNESLNTGNENIYDSSIDPLYISNNKIAISHLKPDTNQAAKPYSTLNPEEAIYTLDEQVVNMSTETGNITYV